jgi:hypothetical protein
MPKPPPTTKKPLISNPLDTGADVLYLFSLTLTVRVAVDCAEVAANHPMLRRRQNKEITQMGCFFGY